MTDPPSPAADSGSVALQVVGVLIAVVLVVSTLVAAHLPERLSCGIGQAVTSVVGGLGPPCADVAEQVRATATTGITSDDAGGDGSQQAPGDRPQGWTESTFSARGRTGPAAMPDVTPVAELAARASDLGRCLGALDSPTAPSLLCFVPAGEAPGGIELLERCSDGGAPGSLRCRSTDQDVRPELDTSAPQNLTAWCQPVAVGAREDLHPVEVSWACASWARAVYFCDGEVPSEVVYGVTTVTEADGVISHRDVAAQVDWAGDRRFWPASCASRTLADRDLPLCTALSADGVTQCTLQPIDERPERVVSCLEFVGPSGDGTPSDVIGHPLHCVAQAGLSTVSTTGPEIGPEIGSDGGISAGAVAGAVSAVGGALVAGGAAIAAGLGEVTAGAGVDAAVEAVAGEEAADPDPFDDSDDDRPDQDETDDDRPDQDETDDVVVVSAGFWRCPANWQEGTSGPCALIPNEDATPADQVDGQQCATGEVWHADTGVCSPPSAFRQCSHPEGVPASATGGSCQTLRWPADVPGGESPCPQGYLRSGSGEVGPRSGVRCQQRAATTVRCVPRTGFANVVAAAIAAQNAVGFILDPENQAQVCAVPDGPPPRAAATEPVKATAGAGESLTCPVVPTMPPPPRKLNEAWFVDFTPGTTSATPPADPLAVAVDRSVDVGALPDTTRWRTDRNVLYRADDDESSPKAEWGPFQRGFVPRNPAGTDLEAWVDGPEYEGAFVSATRDHVFAASWAKSYIYDLVAPGGIDVNATYPDSDWAHEHEVAFPGGIRASQIRSRLAWPPEKAGAGTAALLTNPCFAP